MAKNRDGRGTRYHEEDPIDEERERRHRRRKNREIAEDEAAAKRERRERRRADEARRQAELDSGRGENLITPSPILSAVATKTGWPKNHGASG
jgi:septal ring factor EnvC (AmiA/AmiB activator)